MGRPLAGIYEDARYLVQQKLTRQNRLPQLKRW